MTDREWFDTYARHMVDVELYAEARASLAESTLKRLNSELKALIESYGIITSKAKEAECQKECNRLIEKYLEEWKEQEKEERTAFADREAAFLSGIIKTALGVTLASSLAKIKRALESPFSETDDFDSFAETLKENVKRSVRTPLLHSRIFGTPLSSVGESIDSLFERTQKNTRANMLTSVTALQRNVQYQLIGDDRKLSYRYVSMLDERVCIVCGGYSGMVFETLEDAPDVPVHYRCRCYYLPVLSSSGSQENEEESYQEWFERQPDSVQYDILGPTRYAFFKAGVTHIERFSSGGKKLSLGELFSQEPPDNSL